MDSPSVISDPDVIPDLTVCPRIVFQSRSGKADALVRLEISMIYIADEGVCLATFPILGQAAVRE